MPPIWSATLLFMLLYWISKGSIRLEVMELTQKKPYISDIGAYQMKPVFIVGTTIAISAFEATVLILVDRILRYSPRPGHPDTADIEEKLAIMIAALSVAALAGAILLTILDKALARRAHQACLYTFL